MHAPSDAEVERIAAEAADDLRALAGIWTRDGAAALDAAVRDSNTLSFAVLDARAVGGAVKLVVMRRVTQAVLLEFYQTFDGGRRVIARGLEPYRGALIVADPTLTEVTVGDSADALPAGEPDASRLALELAWRFDVGVSALVHVPVAFATLSFDFAPRPAHDTNCIGPELMRALDSAAALLTGHASYLDGLRTIASLRFFCGLKETDPDMCGIYAIDSQQDGIQEMFHFHREQKKGAWTYAQELAEFETFARKETEGYCRSLLARFRSNAFARL